MKHGGLDMNRLTPAQKVLYSSFLKPMQPHLKNVTGTLQLNNCCMGRVVYVVVN